MRDKLIELIQASVGGCAAYWAGLIADHLIANGVTIGEPLRAAGAIVMMEEMRARAEYMRAIVKAYENGELIHADVPESNVGKWIPVSERLPEKDGEYLAYCGDYVGVSIFYYEILKTRGKWRTKWNKVTHWMPLPKPPKGE